MCSLTVWVGLSTENTGYGAVSLDGNIGTVRTDASKLTTHMVWYILFVIFSTYAMLPLPLLWSAAAAGVTVLSHITTFLTVHYVRGENNPSPWEVIVPL